MVHSIKVRLELSILGINYYHSIFQFHKGAIRTVQGLGAFRSVSYFNSIKVRLERIFWESISRSKSYFNSIKVRLEHEQGQRSGWRLVFQFHKGAIRTSFPPPKYRLPLNFNSIKVRLELTLCHLRLELQKFQFHKGAIRTLLISIPSVFLFHFNSIKVRLEHPSSGRSGYCSRISIP